MSGRRDEGQVTIEFLGLTPLILITLEIGRAHV